MKESKDKQTKEVIMRAYELVGKRVRRLKAAAGDNSYRDNPTTIVSYDVINGPVRIGIKDRPSDDVWYLSSDQWDDDNWFAVPSPQKLECPKCCCPYRK
jgi:hypothetical protein